MADVLILPILVPLATMVATLLLWRAVWVQRVLHILGASALLVVSILIASMVWEGGILHFNVGSWRSPFGITLVADLFSAVMLFIVGLTGLAVAIYSIGSIDDEREKYGFYPLYHALIMGVSGAFLAGDLFNLYVWFEIMLISSFVLLVQGNEKEQLRGASTYVIINLLSSLCFLAAIGLLYGLTGSLNLADLAVRLPGVDAPGVVTTIAMLFVIAFGIKAAIFPLYFWLPASYHTPPVAVSAIFAGLLTKVGVYALIRVFTLLFTQDTGYTHGLLLGIALLTMVTGVLGAAAQYEFRKVLSFHIVSQIGYMVLGLALFTPLALLGAVFYIVHHIVVKTNLFLVSGIAHRYLDTFELTSLGGLYRSKAWLAILFSIPALSLAGLPPLSGFWAKLVIIRAGLEAEAYIAVAIALAVGLLTLYSMTKIWNEAFWKPLTRDVAEISEVNVSSIASTRSLIWMVAPVVLLAGVTLAIGLYAEPLAVAADRVAGELLLPEAYVDAVLGPASVAER
ncbi:Na+/H+ antiporter subunit D [Longibacter salinarum]|uniref:Na+/H+ antiporter subunit D n=1 Tax=Longibacter salinarum TaxID=1850348 RepID=A0A2A8D1S9_9BACT|nr:Na+/H+ antiporter subunit D [Longibacter salinarum]PEN14840.1 Na+/H+ antiporter subunit D [Longibacter salinarum]